MPQGLGIELGLGGGRSATSSGAPPSSGGGYTGNVRSLELDGVDDYASLGSSITLSEDSARTISAWFNIDTDTGTRGIIGGSSHYFGVGYAGSLNYLYYYGGASPYPYATYGAGSVNLDTWHHLAVVDDGTGSASTVVFYLNGVSKVATNSTSGNFDFTFQDIGRKGSDYWPGFVDEIAVWESALTAGQITNIYKGEDSGGSGGTNGTPGDLDSFNPLHWWRNGDDNIGETTITDQGDGTAVDGSLENEAAFATDVP